MKRKTKSAKQSRAYHHGNLRAALVDVARRLIVERGPHGFSLVEAATLAGVSPAAPYRHFANREALWPKLRGRDTRISPASWKQHGKRGSPMPCPRLCAWERSI